VKKERWDRSDDLARTLQAEDFGPIDRVREMAHMSRQCETYAQARKIMSSLIGYPLVSGSGLQAAISGKSIEKILSGKSIADSHDFKSHLLAAGNIDQLYINAIEPWNFEMNPDKNNDGLERVHRLFSPMEYKGDINIVKITVKEMKNPKDGNRIYTIKALDVLMNKKIEDAVS